MSFKKIAMTLALILSTVVALAQTKTVKGVIYEEETGEPMPGATVSVEGSTRGVMTDLDGSFELTGVKPTDKLKFECLGKETQILEVGTMTNFVVKLKNAANELDEVTVVAFGKQRKESVIGSISTVDVKTLKVPSSNLTTALAGNVAGVIAYQRTGEPGQDNADFFVRGITTFGANTSPLILIDNIELTSTDLARLQPDDIESFSIMKDATATALYGARGANGVIFVTTKRGQEGPAKIFARVETSISAPTDVVELADPVTYMKSYNEAISTRDPLGELMYSYDKIEQTGKPDANRLIYPANDWYDMLFKDFATSYRANVSARGGGKVATYYVSGAYTEDTGVLKVDKRNSFNNNIDDKNYTLRSNVDINVTPTTKLAVRLTGNFRDYQGPLNGGSDVYRQIMHSDPVLFPAYYPVDDEHTGIQHIMFGNYEDGSYINPYANLVKGYKNYQRSQMIAAVQLEQDLKFITKGLSFMTLFNLTRLSEFTVNRQFNPYWYTLDRYDSYTGEYHVRRINDNGTDYLTYSESGKTVKNTMYSESRLNYNRSFGRHDVTGLLVLTASESLTANAGSLQLSLPSRNAGLSGRFTYGFDKRYFIEYNFGYNGSENFAKGKRYGFFPSGAVGWLISEEHWMEEARDVLSKLKLRGSIGLVGNDNIGGSRRFAYITTINRNANGYNWGYTGDVYYQGVREGEVGVANLTWETARKADVGFELGLYNDLDLQVDFFRELRSNIFMQRNTIPSQVGFISTPYANYGKVDNRGVDLSMTYNYRFRNGLNIALRGTFTYAKNTILEIDEPEAVKGTHRSRTGQSINTLWGYTADGLYTDDDFDADGNLAAGLPVPQLGATVRPGDIKYVDMNGDGKITDEDQGYIGGTNDPRIVYGFGGNLEYKGFDFNIFFQGTGDTWRIIGGNDYFIPGSGQGVLGNVFTNYNDRWTESNPSQHVFWPRLSESTNTNNNVASTWWKKDMSFLRLKTIEVGYSLPKKALDKMHAKKFRISLSGNNLFCFSSFKLWDPELATNDGLRYPAMRSGMVGIEIGF